MEANSTLLRETNLIVDPDEISEILRLQHWQKIHSTLKVHDARNKLLGAINLELVVNGALRPIEANLPNLSDQDIEKMDEYQIKGLLLKDIVYRVNISKKRIRDFEKNRFLQDSPINGRLGIYERKIWETYYSREREIWSSPATNYVQEGGWTSTP